MGLYITEVIYQMKKNTWKRSVFNERKIYPCKTRFFLTGYVSSLLHSSSPIVQSAVTSTRGGSLSLLIVTGRPKLSYEESVYLLGLIIWPNQAIESGSLCVRDPSDTWHTTETKRVVSGTSRVQYHLYSVCYGINKRILYIMLYVFSFHKKHSISPPPPHPHPILKEKNKMLSAPLLLPS